MNLNPTDIIVVYSTFAIFIFLIFIFVIYALFVNKRNKLILENQQQQLNFEKELAESQSEIKEQTLNFVGQELHDNIGQKLTAIKIWINQLKSQANNPKQIESLNESVLLISETIEDVRTLSKSLISEQVKYFGLLESIEREIQRNNQYGTIEIKFQNTNEEIDINNQHALILFRIFQELFINSLKHSKTKTIEIIIENLPKQLSISIKDFGVGFNSKDEHIGSGLKNIKQRAKLINSEIDVYSEIGKGSTFIINYKK